METVVELNPQVVGFIVGTVVPIVVGLLTKLDAPKGVKAAANALLSAVSGVLVSVIEQGGTLMIGEAVFTVGVTWVTSVATYYGLYKPTGASKKVQDKTASFGVGPRRRSA